MKKWTVFYTLFANMHEMEVDAHSGKDAMEVVKRLLPIAITEYSIRYEEKK